MATVKNKRKLKRSVIVSFFTFMALAFMTTGFALYGQVLDFSGTAYVVPNGPIYISNVRIVANSLVNAAANPEISDDGESVDFNLTFTTKADASATYGAQFDITITNESYYDYVYTTIDYPIVINRQSNGALINSSYVGYTITGISSGDIIYSKQSKTFRVTFAFTNPYSDRTTDTFVINGDFAPNVTEDTEAHILASLVDSTEGDLRGDKDLAKFFVSVLSTYAYSQTFTISLSSDLYEVVDQYGNPLGSLSIDAGVKDVFAFFIKEKSNVDHSVDVDRIAVYVTPTNAESITAGRVSIYVDRTIIIYDETPPQISNVVATIQDEVGSVHLKWDGEDDSNVNHYVILVKNKRNAVVRRIETTDDNDEITITGLNQTGDAAFTDINYYFVVFGVDNVRPTANTGESYVDRASTNPGPACRTTEEAYRWNFKVTYSCSNGLTCNSGENVTRNATHEGTIALSNTSYNMPQSITVSMTNVSSPQYNFNRGSSTSTVTVYNIVGDVTITAAGTSGGGCLVEGTKVMLWDGTYKNIEDIDYYDLLTIYDHQKGRVSYAYPVWVETKHEANYYIEVKFSDGSVLNAAPAGHSIFSKDLMRYANVIDKEFKVGSTVYKLDNNKLKEVQVQSIKKIEKNINYYNLITVGYYNFIANDFLAQENFANATNSYTFKGKNLKYGASYYLIKYGPKLDYDYFKNTVPYHIYKGSNLGNAFTMIGENFDEDFLRKFALEEIKEPYKINDNNAWFVTTSLDDLNGDMMSYLHEQGTYYTLPDNKDVRCFFSTYDDKCYKPGEKVLINHSLHFIAIYK